MIDYVFEQTDGQPWLVNALGYKACFRAKAARDRTRLIGLTLLADARERLIERRDTHLDQSFFLNPIQRPGPPPPPWIR
ncbi:hypothetical protein [Candidatus Thiosymbion oneisti]|uniref:hypothetical protein n=1 Tax=Candidatus Thiosymbion oneisti TaxID=589554 RepID=UPI000A9D85BF|nr:hypothetical protein [Candidatus Thiosymbion oneisti]